MRHVDADELQQIRRFLSAGEWFGGLSPALQELILQRSLVRRFDKGQVISLEDTVPKGLFALLEGHVHLVRDLGAGEEGLMHVGEPGFWFGEFGVLTGRPTLVTAIAHSPVRALVLSKAQVDHILGEEPRYYAEFARLAFERYEALLRVFVEVHGLSPEARLRRRLAAMAKQRQQDRPSADPQVLDVSQGDLARMVGISRQTLNVVLGRLQEQGLVEVGFRRIRVIDAARLADVEPVEQAPSHEAEKPRAGRSGESAGAGTRQTDR
jgi:CRP-like cAMP-binding protein